MPVKISLRIKDVAELFRSRWWELKSLRSLLAADAGIGKALGYDIGPNPGRPEYAFLATDVRSVKRLFVCLDLGALVAFDLVASPEAHLVIQGVRQVPGLPSPPKITTVFPSRDDLSVVTNEDTLDLRWRKTSGDSLFLNVIGPADDERPVPIASIDMAGVRIRDRAVVFYTESTSARSAVSFDVPGSGNVKHLVAGLAPGSWEIWRNGWLEDPQGFVEPQAGALYFEAPAGNYYFRKLA
jgi:hypothetical protein